MARSKLVTRSSNALGIGLFVAFLMLTPFAVTWLFAPNVYEVGADKGPDKATGGNTGASSGSSSGAGASSGSGKGPGTEISGSSSGNNGSSGGQGANGGASGSSGQGNSSGSGGQSGSNGGSGGSSGQGSNGGASGSSGQGNSSGSGGQSGGSSSGSSSGNSASSGDSASAAGAGGPSGESTADGDRGDRAGERGDGEHEGESDNVVGLTGNPERDQQANANGTDARALARSDVYRSDDETDVRILLRNNAESDWEDVYCGCDVPRGFRGCVPVLTVRECRSFVGPGPWSERREEIYQETFPLFLRAALIERGFLAPETIVREIPAPARGLEARAPGIPPDRG